MSGKEGPRSLNQRVMEVLRRRRGPVKLKELSVLARVTPRERREFDHILAIWRRKGIIVQEKSTVGLAEYMALVDARIVTVQERFGFARPLGETDRAKDIFLPGQDMKGAVPGDIVRVRIAKDKRGKVVEILEETQETFTGVVEMRNGRLLVCPDKDLRIPMEIWENHSCDAKPGDKVLAAIGSRGQGHFTHKVRILKVFGDARSARNCCEAVLASYDAPVVFPPEVLEEARQWDGRGVSDKDRQGREDMTGLPCFTIDGADCKDMDDAISLVKQEDGWELGVHIADVTHYVQPGSALDREAYKRGTSVYYADQVLPMLPPELSNGICSLNPDEDRLTFSAMLHISPDGQLQSWRFVKGVIRSRVKGVYDEVNAILAGTASQDILDKYEGLIPTLWEMKDLASVLHSQRVKRGAMDLDSDECQFVINKEGKVEDILPRSQGESEQFIEEFMLSANEAAATTAMNQEIPFMYRIHEKPMEGKVDMLKEMLTQIRVDTQGLDNPADPHILAAILRSVKGTELEQLVNNQLLRTMAKAVYSHENRGHFGLVLDNYAHFTAPIRRYPDLTIHRVLSMLVEGAGKSEIKRSFEKKMPQAALHCSEREQAAVNIERDCEDCYKAEYMSSHLGEVYEGQICSVVPFGFYVRLPNTVEGLVHINTLQEGDYVVEGSIELLERMSNTRYRVGQAVRVKTVRADVAVGQIDFALEE